MAGETNSEALCAYLSRLLDRTVAEDDSIALRSVQKAALSAWSRKRSMAIDAGVLASRGATTPRRLLSGICESGEPVRHRAPEASRAEPSSTILGIGIDIEEIDSLPKPHDYRTDPFFSDHFSDTEIAHCVRQADVAASFCGLWAAKEAILKSGMPVNRLSDIAISHDAAGRPQHPQCQISISHTRQAAVALCLRLAEPHSVREQPSPAATDPGLVCISKAWRPSAAVTAACVALIVATLVLLTQKLWWS